jgi:DNA-binding MarR family transcriptional regulator
MKMSDPQTIYSLINEIYLILDDGDRRLLNDFNLSSTRFYALVHIGERPGISLSDLSQRLICDKSNATRIIKGLEADGLVYRQPHETDGRTLRLFLTDKGLELRNKTISAHQRYNNLRFVKLPPTEQESLSQGLQDLKQSLYGHLEETAPV